MGLKEDLEDYEIEVNEWGSVQYAGALHAYKVFMARVEAKGLDGTIREFEDLGIKFRMDVKGEKEPLEGVRKALLEEIDGFYQGIEMDDYDKEHSKEYKEAVLKMTKVQDAFEICKQMAWDLWAAAAFVARACGVELEEVPPSRGVGPVFNVAAQGQNLDTGLQCALLRAHGLVQDEDVFRDFDT